MIQRSSRLGLLCALLVAAGSSSAAAQTITYGPHAANYRDDQGLKVPEVEAQVENEWLASSENDTFRSPTSRVDGGKILYDFCPPGTTQFPTAVELWVKSPTGAQHLALNDGYGYVHCKGEFQVPWSKAVYELRAYENYSRNGSNPKTLIATKEIPYAAPWVVILGDSYSSGEGAPEILSTGISEQSLTNTVNDYFSNINPEFDLDDVLTYIFEDDVSLESKVMVASSLHESSEGDAPRFRLPTSTTKAAWRRGEEGPHDMDTNACHRSSRAWGFQTAQQLQQRFGIPIDISIHACSGAKANASANGSGVYGYAGSLHDQLAILKEQIRARGRNPDVVLFTFGGNDFHFSDHVRSCMTEQLTTPPLPEEFLSGCSLWFKQNGPFIEDSINQNAGALYDNISADMNDSFIKSKDDGSQDPGVAKIPVPQPKIFIATYPSPAGKHDRNCTLGAQDIARADYYFLTPLNKQIRSAATRNNWGLVELEGALGGNGYCTKGGGFHDMGTSYVTQGDPKGTFHPNSKGHAWMAQAAVAQFQSDPMLENYLRGAVHDLGQEAFQQHFLPDDKQIVLTGGAPFNEKHVIPLATPLAESKTILSDRFFLNIEQIVNKQSKLGISVPLQMVEIDGQPYDPSKGIQATENQGAWQLHKVKIRMFRQSNMTPYVKNTVAGQPMKPEIHPVEFSVLQVSPEVFDQQIKMWLVDPVSGVEIRQDLISLLFREGPPVVIGGGWIGGVEARFELPKEASMWLSRRCGDVKPQDPKAFFPNIQERVALRANTLPVSGPAASWSVFDGDFYDEKAPLNQQTCWKNVPGGQPQSALLDLHVDLPGLGVLHGKRPIHVSVAPDTEHWQTAVDLALDIDGEGTRWAVCDASFQDFLQDGDIHDGSAIQGCVSYKAPLHAGTTAVNRFGVACDDTRAYACLHENKGFSPRDFLGRRWLNLSAVPFPVWTGFGDHGRSIEGVHVEVDGMPVQAKTLPWDRDIWPSDRIVLTHPSLPSQPVPAHGTSLPEYNGNWLFQQQLPPGPHRLEVYACLNKQATCSDSVAIKQEPQIVQERGYARVLDTSFEAP